MSELVLYLDVAADGADEAELARVLGSLKDVTAVEVEAEDVERSGATEMINSFTVVLTASAGTVGAATLLLGQVKALVESVRGLRKAWVQTDQGAQPLDEAAAQAPE